ncbi:uncharacterized protein LOC143018483 isoform X2 [Oratosquilla oratoria]|uniref:uncharacterized protein LOC143018483 isoform X2 n=1 Tax=Oratosquilla oratoria TaxID=337810 RepID=UPI003F775D3C
MKGTRIALVILMSLFITVCADEVISCYSCMGYVKNISSHYLMNSPDCKGNVAEAVNIQSTYTTHFCYSYTVTGGQRCLC